ncbi:MAG: PIG-L family deacetylase, partial [Gammaproteobacteria bacterium]
MNTLVVGPHPDDELLGCGGTLLRRVSERGNVGWLLL